MPIQVTAVVGSNSSTSNNRKLLNFMKKRYAGQLDIKLVEIKDIELYSIDIENNPPAGAKAFKDEMKVAKALLFAVPEYNFSIPGALKNALDWISRGGEFPIKEKPTFIIGSSIGLFGSVRAQIQLREILSNPGLAPNILPGNEVYIGQINTKMNEVGDLTDEGTLAFLDSVVNNFVAFYEKQVAITK